MHFFNAIVCIIKETILACVFIIVLTYYKSKFNAEAGGFLCLAKNFCYTSFFSQTILALGLKTTVVFWDNLDPCCHHYYIHLQFAFNLVHFSLLFANFFTVFKDWIVFIK